MLLEEDLQTEYSSDFMEEVEESAYKGKFLPDLTELAKQYIVNFFADKEMHCGGPIPTRILLTQRNISLVMNASVEATLPRIYSCIEPHFEQLDADSGLLAEDVKLVISILKQCSQAGIPKEFATGILVVYLECCEGLNLWD
jgi:hypothetical protein